MPGGGAFVEDLRALIDAGRAFGRHPLWLRIAEGQLPRAALGPFVVQFFLQVREFPRAVSALHSSCPDLQERIELAESLYEEETGRISGCNVSHPELFIRFGEGVGVPRDAMVNGVPFATTAALIDWFERSTKQHPFIEGAAATNLAAEGQVPGAFGRQPGGWGRGSDVGRYVNFPRLSLTARPHGRNQIRPTAAVRPRWGGGL